MASVRGTRRLLTRKMGSSGVASERGWRRLLEKAMEEARWLEPRGVGMEFAGWSLKSQPPTVGVAMLSSSRERERERGVSFTTDLYDRSFCMPRFHARGHAPRLLARWNATRE